MAGMARSVLLILVVALLVGGLCAYAYDPLPPLEKPASIAPLRQKGKGDAHKTKALKDNASAREHIALLKSHPLHESAFFVKETVGNLDSKNVVFYVPQFHRNQVMPIVWTSLGDAIIDIQRNIDALLTQLINKHHTRCIGTEGSWQKRIDLPFELQQVANWSRDLKRNRQALSQFEKNDKGLHAELLKVEQALQRELKRFANIADGVGMAQSRVDPKKQKALTRFGVEKKELNQEGLRLLAELKVINDTLGRLAPEDRSVVADIMQEMWLLEIDDYEKEVLAPLRQGLKSLDQKRVYYRQQNAEAALEKMRRFLALAKHVSESVVKLSAVDAHTDYYREVQDLLDRGVNEHPADDAESSGAKPFALSAAQQKEKARLLKERETLQARYQKITIEQRDAYAADATYRALNQNQTCALVFGMAHKEGIIDAFEQLSKKDDDFALVVVEPYDYKAISGN